MEGERLGYVFSEPMKRMLVDYSRSMVRGLGGPVRARGLTLSGMAKLERCFDPWVPGGPVNPRALLYLGSWWMLREIEISTSRAMLLEVVLEEERPKVAWTLPVSKTDQQALGAIRSHRCLCGRGFDVGSCPAHVAWDHLLSLRVMFPDRFESDPDLPLFPDVQGNPVTKEAVVRTIEEGARRLGMTLESPDGAEKVGGHSLRVTGAQELARLGYHLWYIQLFGRWGSEVVRKYLREAPLDAPTPSASSHVSTIDFVELAEHLSQHFNRKAWPSVPSGVQGSPMPDPNVVQALVEDHSDVVVAAPPRLEVRAEDLVCNLHPKSGVTHRKRTDNKSVCGWRFSNSMLASSPPTLAEGPKVWGQVCRQCFQVPFPCAKYAGHNDPLPWV